MVRVMGHSVPSVAFVTPNWEEWLAPQRVLVPPKVPGRLEQWAGKSLVQIHKDKCGEEQPQEPGGMPGWRGVCRTRWAKKGRWHLGCLRRSVARRWGEQWAQTEAQDWLKVREHWGFHCEDDWALSQIAQRSGWSPSLELVQGRWFLAAHCVWPCLIRRSGPPEFPSNLNHSLILYMIRRNITHSFYELWDKFLSRRLKHWVFNWLQPRFACGSCFWCFWGGMAADTLFSILQLIKSVRMGCTILHAQICWDQKYVENLPVKPFKFVILSWIFHLVLKVIRQRFRPHILLNLRAIHNFKTLGNIFYDASIPNCCLIHCVYMAVLSPTVWCYCV